MLKSYLDLNSQIAIGLLGPNGSLTDPRTSIIRVPEINIAKDKNLIIFNRVDFWPFDKLIRPINIPAAMAEINKAKNDYFSTKTPYKERYHIYLKSERWRTKREAVLKRDNYLCQACLEKEATQAHHTTYDYVGLDPLFVLKAVCIDCHDKMTMIEKLKGNDLIVYGGFSDYLIVERRLFDTYEQVLDNLSNMRFTNSHLWIGDRSILINGDNND